MLTPIDSLCRTNRPNINLSRDSATLFWYGGDIMKRSQRLLVKILAGVAFVVAFTCQASAGYFPERPDHAKLRRFSGVLNDYGIGNDTGWFSLTTGSKELEFCIGTPMRMNGKVVTCMDPEQKGVKVDPIGDICPDWPSWLVEGKTYVTATCWWDSGPPESGDFGWCCDEIDKAKKSGH